MKLCKRWKRNKRKKQWRSWSGDKSSDFCAGGKSDRRIFERRESLYNVHYSGCVVTCPGWKYMAKRNSTCPSLILFPIARIRGIEILAGLAFSMLLLSIGSPLTVKNESYKVGDRVHIYARGRKVERRTVSGGDPPPWDTYVAPRDGRK